MKKTFMGLMVVVFAVAMISTNALAKEKKEKAAGDKKACSAVSGTLACVKDADGNVTCTTITTKSGQVYTVEGLAQDVSALDGKGVTAKGEVKDANGAMTLAVKGDIKAAAEKKEKKAPAEKKEKKEKKAKE